MTDGSSNNPAQPCPILVINLKRSSDRLATVTTTLEQLGLSFERFEAADGSQWPESDLALLAPDPGLAFFKSLTRGEVGCAISHRTAIQLLEDNDWPCALILEDDFAFEAEYTRDGGARLRALLAELCANAANGPDVINLFGQRPRGTIVRSLGNDTHLMRSVSPPVGNVALFWTRAGADKFMGVVPPFRRPIDVERKHWWKYDLDACWISPPPCVEERVLGQRSTIGARKSIGVRARARKLLYRSMFAVESQCRYLLKYGLTAWIAAQRRVRGKNDGSPRS